MKKLFIGVCLLLCSVAPAYAATVNVVIDPPADPLAITPGETFTVTVSNVDFPQTGGATIGIVWNPAVLDLNSISLAAGAFADLLPNAPSAGDQDIGEIMFFSIFGDLAAPDPIGSFDSFILEFLAVGVGTSDIIIDESETFRGWNASDASIIDGVIYNQASVNVVPVPAAVWLFGSALGLLSWMRRRAA